MSGQLVAGRYRALEQLQGSTWLGRDDESGARVVLRFHEPSTGRWLRLLHEAESLKLLGGLVYLDRQVLVREYVEGATLAPSHSTRRWPYPGRCWLSSSRSMSADFSMAT